MLFVPRLQLGRVPSRFLDSHGRARGLRHDARRHHTPACVHLGLVKLPKRTWCRHFAQYAPVGWRRRPLAMAAAAWHHSWSRPHSLQTQAAAFVLTHRARFAASSAALCGNCTRAHIPQRRSRCRRRDACGHSVRSRHQLKVANDSGLLTTGPLAESMPDEVRGGHHERR